MEESDNADLLVQTAINTHNEQLQTLRQHRSSLIKLTNFNFILLGITVAFAGVAVQENVGDVMYGFFIPTVTICISIIISITKVGYFNEMWGYVINPKHVDDFVSDESVNTVKEVSTHYAEACDKNKEQIESISKSIRIVLYLMALAIGSLLSVVYSVAISV